MNRSHPHPGAQDAPALDAHTGRVPKRPTPVSYHPSVGVDQAAHGRGHAVTKAQGPSHPVRAHGTASKSFPTPAVATGHKATDHCGPENGKRVMAEGAKGGG